MPVLQEIPPKVQVKAANQASLEAIAERFGTLKASGFGKYEADWTHRIETQKDERHAYDDLVNNAAATTWSVVWALHFGAEKGKCLFVPALRDKVIAMHEKARNNPGDFMTHLTLVGFKAFFDTLGISWPEGMPVPGEEERDGHRQRVQRNPGKVREL